jgi:S-disulfanyl-L-cysteine oxidoreductase SoxD
MPRRDLIAASTLLLAFAGGVSAHAQTPAVALPDMGQAVTAKELAGYFAIPPSGAGLPPGSGTAPQGADVYATQCVACHGDKLQGVSAIGAPALVGGRGTLATGKPVRTVESYWPYATTVFDYVKRAMPFNAPGSLTDDQVYAVTAYILSTGHVIAASDPSLTVGTHIEERRRG